MLMNNAMKLIWIRSYVFKLFFSWVYSWRSLKTIVKAMKNGVAKYVN